MVINQEIIENIDFYIKSNLEYHINDKVDDKYLFCKLNALKYKLSNNKLSIEDINKYEENIKFINNILFLKYNKMIYSIIKKYKNAINLCNIDHEEIIAELHLKFLECLNHFNCFVGAFSTYFYHAIKRHIVYLLRKKKSEKIKFDFDLLQNNENYIECDFIDIDDKDYLESIFSDLLKEKIVNQEDLTIFYMIEGQGKTLKEVRDYINNTFRKHKNISFQAIDLINKKTINKIKSKCLK